MHERRAETFATPAHDAHRCLPRVTSLYTFPLRTHRRAIPLDLTDYDLFFRPARSSAMLAALCYAPTSGSAQARTAREIIDQVDRLLRGESSEARFTMNIRTEHWERFLTLRA